MEDYEHTAEGVAVKLIENIHDYQGNIIEMLTNYFEQNPDMLKDWSDWFDGKDM